MASDDMFTDDFRLEPYWWQGAPRVAIPGQELPAQADVVVIGSGYTGLNAALVTARAGRSTLVLEAGEAGSGCSSRNGGQISTSIKPGFDALARRHGREAAFAIIREGHVALAWIGGFIATERIDCDFKVPGRFHAAHNPAAFRKLVDATTRQHPGLEVPFHVVERAEQYRELGTDAYHGGVVYANHACLDPARYHRGLISRVLEAGAHLVEHCAATGVEADGAGFRVTTSRGSLKARDVVIATNGYTTSLTPWHRRRVIPIGSYMIATEPLPRALMNRLMPTNRIISDSRKVVFYYRPSPDRSRIVFGGRVSGGETDPRRSGPLLRNALVALFPELRKVRVSHSWMGLVAYTFDTLAHTGVHQGVHYAMGYCGSGISMASYLGMRTGQRLLGMTDGVTGLDDIAFPTRPLYTGRPWFLPASVCYYRWRDRVNF